MTCVASEEQLSAESKDTAETLSNFFARRPQQANEVKLSLIKLLKTEDNTFVARTNAKPGTYTEEDGEYYAQVIDTVSSLDDERVIPALVGAITTGGMAQRGLLQYGDKALVPVLDQLKNPDAVRATALGMGIKLLEKHNDLASHVHITDLILSSLRDSDGVVRGHAVREIDCLADREDFLSALQQIAKADPDKLPGKALDGGDGDEVLQPGAIRRATRSARYPKWYCLQSRRLSSTRRNYKMTIIRVYTGPLISKSVLLELNHNVED